MRGILLHIRMQSLETRNTPADAGNIVVIMVEGVHSGKHPRRRGEYDIFKQMGVTPQETPPQTRGIFFLPSVLLDTSGNTPADAGNM